MIKDIWPYIGEVLTGLLAGITGWLAKGKIQKASEKADLLIKVQELYDRMVEATNRRMSEMENEIRDLKKEQTSIDAQWRKKVKEIEAKWATKYSTLQSKYNKLVKEFGEYKEQHK